MPMTVFIFVMVVVVMVITGAARDNNDGINAVVYFKPGK